ncbi:acyl-CoA dehydrogenase family protein [Acidisoma cladoniae]|jgi:acyl-CoA dehydrogenase|uniref:acyl-CoA dehydrogenase family protein n=1 Tax=Acidisoma cladoniae TaxID=3040935 RepID=UPI00254B934A|nr:acyl-CoA dehydrogenase family protein [Acidisoma sp. PAMC 29798]
MDFAYSPHAEALRQKLQVFMETQVLPQNRRWTELAESGVYPVEVIEPLKARARAEGLWNLFLPGLREDEPGTRLSNLDYAPLAETMGRLPWAAEVFNCNAPDTGNMEILHLFATPDQRKQWLHPLLTGEIRSVVSITEPDVASSDPTNLQTEIRRDGNDFIINGRKWFNTGALHPKAAFLLVMGVSNADPDAPRHHRHSFIIVPMDAPGFRVVRNTPIMNHYAIEGHCEVIFDNVRVPAANLLGEEHAGFAIAQARLGPGRIHHCMRTIGQCELALELMSERALQRRVFGRALAEFANNQDEIALSRIEIDQARLLCLRAAWRMDVEGNQAARVDVSAIKIVAARLQTRVVDRAMQIFGAMGLTNDTPLAYLWTWGRALRLLDGPDEVHLRVVSREEVAKAKARGNTPWSSQYVFTPER